MPQSLAVLDVIADPTRRRILDAVRDDECSVGDLVERVGMHQPGVSRHLKVLRDAGLVEVRRDAQRRYYRLRAEPLRELDAWLEPYRQHWAERLDALERHLACSTSPAAPTPQGRTSKAPTPKIRPPRTRAPMTPTPKAPTPKDAT